MGWGGGDVAIPILFQVEVPRVDGGDGGCPVVDDGRAFYPVAEQGFLVVQGFGEVGVIGGGTFDGVSVEAVARGVEQVDSLPGVVAVEVEVGGASCVEAVFHGLVDGHVVAHVEELCQFAIEWRICTGVRDFPEIQGGRRGKIGGFSRG